MKEEQKTTMQITNLTTDQLIQKFTERRKGTIAILRMELRRRFIECRNDDTEKITAVFNRATKIDRLWVETQNRKAQSLGEIPF